MYINLRTSKIFMNIWKKCVRMWCTQHAYNAKAAIATHRCYLRLLQNTQQWTMQQSVHMLCVKFQVFTQRPRNGQIKLCNCANREIQLNKLWRNQQARCKTLSSGPCNNVYTLYVKNINYCTVFCNTFIFMYLQTRIVYYLDSVMFTMYEHKSD